MSMLQFWRGNASVSRGRAGFEGGVVTLLTAKVPNRGSRP